MPDNIILLPFGKNKCSKQRSEKTRKIVRSQFLLKNNGNVTS